LRSSAKIKRKLVLELFIHPEVAHAYLREGEKGGDLMNEKQNYGGGGGSFF